MNKKHTKSKTAIFGGIVAISLLSPLAHAQIIFYDDFTEDYSADSSHGGYNYNISGTQNNLTYAPAGAPTNDLAWTSNYSNASNQYGTAIAAGSGYPTGTTATNGSKTEIFISPAVGAGTNSPEDVWTPIETGTGSAVNLVAGASYTLSFDVGDRTDQTMSTLGIDLLTGGPIGSGNGDPNTGTVLAPSTGGFTDEVTRSQLLTTGGGNGSGTFTNFSITIPASALVGDSGALYLELVNTSNANQVNVSNIELSEAVPVPAVPEPGTWAMMLGGLGALFFFQRLRRGHKV